MPRKPKATRPKAKTAEASKPLTVISAAEPLRADQPAVPIRTMRTMPIQKALKLPAVRPGEDVQRAPPSREEVTTSRTCADSVDVKTLTSSGMIAPASVPQVMMAESFHQSVGVAAEVGNEQLRDDERQDDGDQRGQPDEDVSGCSKLNSSALLVPRLRASPR